MPSPVPKAIVCVVLTRALTVNVAKLPPPPCNKLTWSVLKAFNDNEDAAPLYAIKIWDAPAPPMVEPTADNDTAPAYPVD